MELTAVWTNRGVFRYIYKHDKLPQDLYKWIEHSPLSWKSKRDIPPTLFNFDSDDIPKDENCLSHQEIWEMHQREEWEDSLEKMKANYDYVHSNFDKFDIERDDMAPNVQSTEDKDESNTSVKLDVSNAHGLVTDQGDSDGVDEEFSSDEDSDEDDHCSNDNIVGKSKMCEDCKLPNSKYHRICKACKCKLKTLLQIKQSNATTTKFRERAKMSSKRKEERRSSKTVSIDPGTLNRENFQPFNNNSSSASHKSQNPHEHSEVSSGDRTFSFKMLPSLMINPTGKGSLRQIYEE